MPENLPENLELDRRQAARLAIEEILVAYCDMFGPSQETVELDEHPHLDSWVIVTHFSDLGSSAGWTCAENSGCSYPMQLGLLTEVLNGWGHRQAED